jgi:hypothetical protein
VTFGASSAPLWLGASVGPDDGTQEHSSPSSTSLSLDLTLQPGGSGAVTPYPGGSVGSYWSGGGAKPFDGAPLTTSAAA